MFERRRPQGGWMSHLKILGLALTLTLIVRTVVAEPYVVPTGSMAPTLWGWRRTPVLRWRKSDAEQKL